MQLSNLLATRKVTKISYRLKIPQEEAKQDCRAPFLVVIASMGESLTKKFNLKTKLENQRRAAHTLATADV